MDGATGLLPILLHPLQTRLQPLVLKPCLPYRPLQLAILPLQLLDSLLLALYSAGCLHGQE